MVNIIKASSPNFGSRNGLSVLAVIVHYDASPTGNAAISWMRNSRSGVSANIHIDRDGSITELVPIENAAWHAGTAFLKLQGRSYTYLNQISIGIELANLGKLSKSGDHFFYTSGGKDFLWNGASPIEASMTWPSGIAVSGWWEPFAEPLLKSLEDYLAYLKNRGYNTSNLFGHDEIAMPIGRKMDPGPLFPWSRFTRSVPRTITSK
jgi:N-acetylmuramoyl-L-alanine amidase